MRDFDSARGDIVIAASRLKLVGLAASGVGFFAIGSWLFISRSSQGGSVGPLLVVACLSAAMGLSVGGYALFRLVAPTPAVALTREGLLDNASAMAAGFVPWGSIEAIFVYHQQGQAFLGVVPKDIPAFLETRGALKRLVLRANLRLGMPLIAIPQVVLPMTARELVEQIAARYPVKVLVD